MVKYLHDLAKIRKAERLFGDELDFEDIKFLVKMRVIHKIEKKNAFVINIFGYKNNQIYPICLSQKYCETCYCYFIIDRRKRQKSVCSYQRFQYIHV